MDYLAIKQKKIAKPKKTVNIIFGDSGSQIEEIKEKEFIIDRIKTSGFNRKEIEERIHLLNPTIKSTIITKSVITVPTIIVPKKRDDEEEEIFEETEEEIRKNEINAEIKLFDNKREQEEGEEEEGEEEEGEQEEKEEQKREKKEKKRIEDILYQPIDPKIKIGDKLLIERLPKQKPIKVQISPHYMTNRSKYIEKITTQLLKKFGDKVSDEDVSCESRSTTEFDELLTHQEIVRDYLNLYTPYRGLLLYHGLGSGKTCSSIAIAEGMKTEKQVVLMTPASLKMNFFSELKKCGDQLYKKNQYWEFISIIGQPKNITILSNSLNIPVAFIKKKKGAWLVDISKESNYSQLSPDDQKNVDEQLNMMIRAKYIDINYNGLNKKKMNELTKDKSVNPFDNRVVIIDEAHNFVSRIVNKLTKKTSLSNELYEYLMDATNVRIVFLTGTPIINYPHEISVLFNILRGYIKTWSIQLKTTTTDKITRDSIMDLFDKRGLNTYDYIEYSGNTLTVTRNPFGFINDLKKLKREPQKEIKNKNKGGTKKKKEKSKEKNKKTKHNKYHNLDYNISKEEQEEWFKHYEGTNNIYEGGSQIENNYYKYEENEMKNIKEIENIIKGGGMDNYNGVIYDETGNIHDVEFQRMLLSILNNNDKGIKTVGEPNVIKYKALPDNSDDFISTFINSSGELINTDVFQRRILGLTSYFRSAQEKLLPSFVKTPDGDNYHVIPVEMSDYQFSVYEKIRKEERENEKKRKKAAKKAKVAGVIGDDEVSSTYRIFSRACCNFAFPSDIKRPLPEKRGDIDETAFNGITKEMRKNADDYDEDDEDEEENQNQTENIATYQKRIENAMDQLNFDPMRQRSEEYLLKEQLATYSPKFSVILENLMDERNEGLHLVYSQFRTIEGIGLLRLILMANGFAEFKLEKIVKVVDGKDISEWNIIENEEDKDKPKFVLYTGTETAEEKEVIRNIYNSAWEFVPPNIVTILKKRSDNNFMGQIIKIFMITSSGAEGINLRNTRFVHIVEPYWNMVRMEQVIGRARRICSHKDLPDDLRTVKVFVYLTILSNLQKTDDKNIELRIQDVSKLDNKKPITTDESLFEISLIKNRTNQQILTAIKETALDCNLFNTNPDEPLMCYSFGKIISNEYATQPDLMKDKSQPIARETNKTVKWKPKELLINDKQYALYEKTNEIYTMESYKNNVNKGTDLVLVGHLIEKEKIINGRKIKEYDVVFDT